MNSDTVTIMLATYNGADYLEQQLNSIVAQTFQNWRLYIRDDGSNDSTFKIIEKYTSKDNRICVVCDDMSPTGSAEKNFAILCEHVKEYANTDFYMFSDQDDIWAEDKLELQWTKMSELIAKYNHNLPILLHSDLQVVDQWVNILHPSFVNLQNIINIEQYQVTDLLYQNVVTGCTSFFNRALLEIATPIADVSPVHDWWFALCAKSFGVLEYIDQPLVKYRQHGNNSIGAKGYDEQRNLLKLQTYRTLYNYPKHILAAIHQAKTLLERKNNKNLPVKKYDLAVIEQFSTIQKCNVFKRISFAIKLFKDKRPLMERLYLYFVFIAIRWVKF